MGKHDRTQRRRLLRVTGPGHAVADPALVDDPGRAGGVVAELVAQPLDVGAHDFGVGCAASGPDLAQQGLVRQDPAVGIVNLLRAARSCPVKSTLRIVLSRRTSPHPIQRTRGCGAGGGEPTAGGVD